MAEVMESIINKKRKLWEGEPKNLILEFRRKYKSKKLFCCCKYKKDGKWGI